MKLLSTSDQPVAETLTWQHTTLTADIRARGGTRTRNLSRRTTAVLRLRPLGHWEEYVTLDKIFYSSFQLGISSTPRYLQSFILIAFLEEDFIRYIIVIICINNNDVINSNYGKFQDLVVLSKILMGTRKNFFEIYRQFGLVSSKSFTSPALDSASVIPLHHMFRSPPYC